MDDRANGQNRGARRPRRLAAALLGALAAAGALGAEVLPVDAQVARCLDAQLVPSNDCPDIAVAVEIEVRGDDVDVIVRSIGEATWRGGPHAFEVPLTADDASPEADDGAVQVVERAGTRVVRCSFEPVAAMETGDEVRCTLPLGGLPAGERTGWITGFVNGAPMEHRSLGLVPPPVGIVALAESRSVGMPAVDGASDGGDDPGSPTDRAPDGGLDATPSGDASPRTGSGAGWGAIATAGLAVVVVGAIVATAAVVARRWRASATGGR